MLGRGSGWEECMVVVSRAVWSAFGNCDVGEGGLEVGIDAVDGSRRSGRGAGDVWFGMGK